MTRFALAILVLLLVSCSGQSLDQDEPLGPCDCDGVCATFGWCASDGFCRCPTGSVECPDYVDVVCVDVMADASHCGECGQACATGEVCTGGVCQ